MRIVQLNPFFFPYFGGIERRIYHLSRNLARRGHDVTVVTGQLPGAAREEEMEGFRVLRVPARMLAKHWNPPVLRTRGTAEALRELDPDVVDYHSRWAPEMTGAVWRAGQRGLPWVFTFHNHFGEGSRWLRPASIVNDRWNLRRIRDARAIACVSPAIRAELMPRALQPDQLHVAPNGCDAPRPGGADWQPDDGRPDPAQGHPYFVTVGRLTPEKGVLDALEAFTAAAPDLPDHHLVICGTGPLRDRLLRRAARRGLEKRVHLEGWVPEATKVRLVSGAQALLNLAPFEAYGIAVAEAIVAGTPAVVYDVGGVAEVAGAAGIAVPRGDVAAAADAMRRSVQPDAQASLRAAALRRGPELAWDAAVTRMERIYAQVRTMDRSDGALFPRTGADVPTGAPTLAAR